MKKRVKRWIALLMAFVMLLSVTPAAVQAEEITTETNQEFTEENPVETFTEEITTEELTEEVTATTAEETTEVTTAEVTTEKAEEITEPVIEKTEELTTEETEEEETLIEKATPDIEEEMLQTKESSESKYMIYHDGEWASSKYRWYVRTKDGTKHYVFCLNHGMTMYTGMYYGNLAAGYSGKSAFKKSVALDYFYKTNGNSWSGSKNYGPVQEVIWDQTGSDTAQKLTSYVNHAWRLTSLNSARADGSGSYYSSKLKGIKKSEAASVTARKKMISELTDSKKIIDLSSSYDSTSDSFKETITLSGSAWKYFSNGGFNGSSSDIVVDGIYDTDGEKITDSSIASASLTSAGNLSVNLKNGKAGLAKDAYTVIMHINFDYEGSDSLNYLLTPDGKQNLAYNAEFNSPAYFAVRIYGKVNQESARLYINKIDEYDIFVSGCTFRLTGVKGDALTNKVDVTRTINSQKDYFEIVFPGYYKLIETAVSNSSLKLNTTEHYIFAKYNDENQLVLYSASKDADGSYSSAGDASIPSIEVNPVHKGEGTASFYYKYRNYFSSGSATLTKYGNILVKYENGKFVYEQRTLDNVGFSFYAAEDIYLNETLIFEKGTEILSGTEWGVYNGADSMSGTGLGNAHKVKIDGTLVQSGPTMGTLTKYKGYTANGGSITISDLPPGEYYCLESDLTYPGLVKTVGRYEFEVVADTTATINGAGGILNEQAPADVYVYKQDGNTKEYISGAEFTIYASINNTNYDGEKLFTVAQTIDVVTQRNLATGDETVESKTWIPLQTVVSDDSGLAMFENLPYGNYLIAETKAPEGYELSEKSIKFTHSLPDSVAADYSNGFIYQFDFGNIKTSTYSIYKKAEKAYLNTESEKDVYIYKDEAVKGVVFGVYAKEDISNTLGDVVYKPGDLVTTCTTNEEGIAEFGGALFAGNYYFKEIQTADDDIYVLDDTEYSFEVTGKENTKVLTDEAILNKQYKGSIKVIKTDGENKTLLSEVTFKLLDADKKELASLVTDEKGEIFIDNLPVGKYYLQESASRANYYLKNDLQEVTLSKEELDKIVNIDNERMKGSIRVIKTDGKTEQLLEGVEFDLLNSEKEVIDSYVTDENGEIHIENLEIGTYYIKETKALKGYKLSDETVKVEISADELDKIVKVKNYRQKTSITVSTDNSVTGQGGVRTGDTSPLGIILALFMLSSLGAAVLLKKKEKLEPAKVSSFVKGKKFLFLLGLTAGTLAIGGLTVKAAEKLKEISTVELKDAEYNGKIYTYALQKQYETQNPEEEISFEEKLDGLRLADVRYEILETILQKKTLEETKDYKDLLVKDESKISDTIVLDGNTYQLQDISWSEEPNIEHVSYTQDYGYAGSEPEPAATYEYTYTSPVTKKENTVTLPFARMERGEYSWVDGFTATVTFKNLDGVYFKLGNHEFKYNPDKLSFTASDYQELVRMLGYDTSKYRLNSASWSGKAYEGKNGELYRNATASGQQYAAYFKAIYEDDVENGKLYTAHATYSCEVEVPAEEAAPIYVIQATGYYENARFTLSKLACVVLGLILLIILFLFGMVLFKKKKSEPVKEEEKEVTIDKQFIESKPFRFEEEKEE